MANPTIHYDGPIVTRSEAKRNSAKRYFTGKACKSGHKNQRLTSNGACDGCNREFLRKRRAADPEKYRALYRAWRAADPERARALVRIAGKKFRAKHAGRMREDARLKYLRNREKILTRHRANMAAWRANNPEKRRDQERTRRARRKKSPGKFTESEVRQLFAKQRSRCAICLGKIKLSAAHRDHIKPLSKGGANTIANIQVTCSSCNLSKSNKDPYHFALQIGRLL